jgi:plasmid stabilization system protein ParE
MGIVRLSHLADGDLDGIRNSILPHNPAAADRVLEDLFQALELLAGNRKSASGTTRFKLAYGR